MGGRDIDVVSMVLTLVWARGAWVFGVCFTSSRFFSELLFSSLNVSFVTLNSRFGRQHVTPIHLLFTSVSSHDEMSCNTNQNALCK